MTYCQLIWLMVKCVAVFEGVATLAGVTRILMVALQVKK